MDKNVWFSGRALRLHAVILIVVPGFMALCVWQITRALGGNSLSWAYVFEWPLFAGYAIYMWWRLVHEGASSEPAAADVDGDAAARRTGAPIAATGEPAQSARGASVGERTMREEAELAAYNDYLAQLAEQDRATRQGRHG